MRQSGMIAAAGVYALDHHVERLADDHAQRAADRRRALPRAVACELDLEGLETNIVVFHLGEGAPDAATVVARAAEPTCA